MPPLISPPGPEINDVVCLFDHFHIIKLYNDKLSELRRHLYHETSNYKKAEILKGTRWLLLKNPENLNEQKGEIQHLEKALKLNKPLAKAYYLKEELRELWNQDNKEKALRFLEHWISQARHSGVTILEKISNTISAHRSGILAWYDYPISTGPLEGTNNKIKNSSWQDSHRREKYCTLFHIYDWSW